jgi:hypothetical protein
MFPLWHEKRALLERAATDGDVVTVSRVLSKLDPINVEFIDLLRGVSASWRAPTPGDS